MNMRVAITPVNALVRMMPTTKGWPVQVQGSGTGATVTTPIITVGVTIG